MATSTLIPIPIYQIGSQQLIDRTLYPFGNIMMFAGASIQVQPNTGATLQQLQACGVAGAALIYSSVRTAAIPGAIFFSNLTPAAIQTLANA
jgi:hypothetical protein